MYNWAVSIKNDGTVLVASIGATGWSNAGAYKNLEEVPKDIRDKVKLLMWTPIDGRSEYQDLGIRIGTTLYWVM